MEDIRNFEIEELAYLMGTNSSKAKLVKKFSDFLP